MSNIVRFIGDVHGLYSRYKTLLKNTTTPSIQVGDMGVGFFRTTHDGVEACENPPHSLMVKKNARFIRGNHDNPSVCERHSQWISDGTIENIGNSKVMFNGGAWSIDSANRFQWNKICLPWRVVLYRYRS